MILNVYAIINGINSLLALAIASFIFLKKERKPLHTAFATWLFTVFLWSFFYFLWGISTDRQTSIIFYKILMGTICFVHMAYFHFALLFSDNLKKFKKILIIGYILSLFLLAAHFFGMLVDLNELRHKYSFLFWPRQKKLLLFLISVQIYYVLTSFLILYGTFKKSHGIDRSRLKYFIIFSIIAWTGGLTNWLPFYDSVSIPPIGNTGVTIFIIVLNYLILRHNILGLNLVIQKTIVYGLLTFFITMSYIASIFIFEKFFQAYIGYNSTIATIFAAMLIAFLFSPMRSYFTKSIDKYFFGKNIQELSDENVQMKMELQKTDQMKAVATLASGMAHEIKNPLTAIKTFTDHLKDKSQDPQFIAKFEKVVGSEVDKIDSLVKRLLDFSKPSPLKIEPAHINKLLDETMELLNGEFIKKKIKIERNYQDQITVDGDNQRLKQAFLNIYLNSIEAMPNGGSILTSVLNKKNQSVIIIRDTGCGIPRNIISQIFDPFFTTKEAGSGLGLSIVRGIIEEHGGRVDAKSVLNEGTAFRIFLIDQ